MTGHEVLFPPTSQLFGDLQIYLKSCFPLGSEMNEQASLCHWMEDRSPLPRRSV